MVIGENFVWTHLPRTGGDSTVSMFEVLGFRSVYAKSDHRKHTTLAAAIAAGLVESKVLHICNFRRLIGWLTSMAMLQLRFPGGIFDRRLALRGEVYLLLNDQTTAVWRAKIDDVLIDYMSPRVDAWLRTEYLAQDFLRLMERSTPATGEQSRRIGAICENRGGPARRLWTEREYRQIYAACPLWASIERELYGAVSGGRRGGGE